MPICPCCGEIVVGGDPYCPNCGTVFVFHGESDDYSKRKSRHRFTSREKLELKGSVCESYLNDARSTYTNQAIIRNYKKALECAEEYFNYKKNNGLYSSITSMDDFFSKLDVAKCADIHYKSQIYYIFSPPSELISDCEEILTKTGNEDIVRLNNDKIEKMRQEKALENKKSRLKGLRDDYFRHCLKAQENMEKSQFRNAFGEYEKAIGCYDSYYKEEYNLDSDHDKMPDERLTESIVDDLLTIYANTHPLLTSGKDDLKINSKIVEILDGKYDRLLSRMDDEAEKIQRQRQIERQRIKEELMDSAEDVIVGARILGDEIFKLLKR